MCRVARERKGCLLCLLGAAAAVSLFPSQGIIWDGGFERAEYRPTFTDGAGRPVRGVTPRVLTRAGGECHPYPIDEYLPDRGPTSDAGGRTVFRHVGNGLEFGGREHANWLGMRFGETTAPQYAFAFWVAGREVRRIRVGDLRRGGRDGLPSNTRSWRSPDWP